MCGIAGFWARHGGNAAAQAGIVAAMTQTLRHRGPDDDGVWVDGDLGIALGHRRLAILDLSPAGHQPMVSSNGRFVITYNGEVYNFADLRRELERKGARFRGQSDTEVIVEGCVHFGVEDTIDRLNGMFAIALWDAHERRLYLARDRMGEKPLYFAAFGPLVLFASELKSLRAHPGWQPRLARDAVAGFLRHNYVPGPFSIYEGVRKVPPGGLVVIEREGTPRERLYWDLAAVVRNGRADPLPPDEELALEGLESLLSDAVARRMVSDVPLGAFLSGGYDSSLIVALMQEASTRPVKTFTIGFQVPDFDEAAHAEAVARHLGTQHTTFVVTGEEARVVVPNLAQMYDEPFADSSQLPTHVVSALTRKHVTVALSGDGGDELLTGYNRYRWAERTWMPMARTPLAVRRMAAAAIRAVPIAAYDRMSHLLGERSRLRQLGYKAHRVADLITLPNVDAVYRRLVSHIEAPADFVRDSREVCTPVWNEDLRSLVPDAVDRMRYLDMRTYLPDDILTKVDRASMAVALEVRVPFLDHRVVEWVWRLPLQLNARASRPKHLIRRMLERRVPTRITDRPKMGFGVPLGQWLRGPLKSWGQDLLSAQTLRRDGVLDPAPVDAAWRDLLGGSDRFQYLLWNVLMFQSWQKAWNAPPPAPVYGGGAAPDLRVVAGHG
jgi:asparagine synthase (glutamine-hydrolysing)